MDNALTRGLAPLVGLEGRSRVTLADVAFGDSSESGKREGGNFAPAPLRPLTGGNGV